MKIQEAIGIGDAGRMKWIGVEDHDEEQAIRKMPRVGASPWRRTPGVEVCRITANRPKSIDGFICLRSGPPIRLPMSAKMKISTPGTLACLTKSSSTTRQ